MPVSARRGLKHKTANVPVLDDAGRPCWTWRQLKEHFGISSGLITYWTKRNSRCHPGKALRLSEVKNPVPGAFRKRVKGVWAEDFDRIQRGEESENPGVGHKRSERRAHIPDDETATTRPRKFLKGQAQPRTVPEVRA
jgi:hypothetical protein